VELNLRAELSKRFSDFGKLCLSRCEDHCKKLIARDLENVESLIRQELVGSLDDLLSQIEKLKERYFETTKSIVFATKDFIFAQVSEKLLLKGVESIIRSDKDQA